MRTKIAILALALGALYNAGTGISRGQALLPADVAASDAFATSLPDAPDASQFNDGTKAIRESRWAEAVKIFDKVAKAKGPHAAGALYWKAYAESKLGDPNKVLESCAALRSQFAGSTWVDDCGALEIEVHASNGKPLPPEQMQNDELKLLALAALMQKDPTRAKSQIEDIMQGDSSEQLKEGALFILGRTQPDETYPEIVRISYLEGDVRIARATKNDAYDKGATWETAVMNLPLQQGDNLVTGKDGRVEIEFEDDSTVYLAENSALNLQDLHSTSGVPHTELALVSGAVTMHLDSLMPGETFVLHTPKNELLTRYPQKADLRVSSYLDATAVTPLVAGKLGIGATNSEEQVTPDKTFLFEEGHKMTTAAPGQAPDYQAFDAWVADRFAARTADTKQVMQEAGLKQPIPGLAQLKGKGSFYDCQPYGKCWQPAPKKSAFSGSGGPASGSWGMNSWFPCMGWAMGYGFYPGYMGFQPAVPMPADIAFQSMGWGMMDPYAWAVCHAGDWMPQSNGSYAWVIGPRFHLHHRPPVRWIRTGHTVAAVPIHPRDVNGKPPLNREHGFVGQKGKGGLKVMPVTLQGGEKYELMKQPPREFRRVEEPILGKAGAPRMMARTLSGIGNARSGVVPMTFNRQQGFITTREVIHGGHSVAVNTPVGRSGPVFAGSGFGGAPVGFGGAGNGGFRGGSPGGFQGGSGLGGASSGPVQGGPSNAAGAGSISVSSGSPSAGSSGRTSPK